VLWHGAANGVPRAYVHESVADAFVAEAKKALVELSGNDLRSNSDYSRIIYAHGGPAGINDRSR
jgi:aldehyde dehydrogenase (NAD+)